jgi:uncharacterized membrane protein YfcA
LRGGRVPFGFSSGNLTQQRSASILVPTDNKLENLLSYLIVGACAGLLSGLLGVGGGVVIVPALAIIFQNLAMPQAIVLHMAIGTSLATIVITSLSAIYAHYRRGTIQWWTARQLAPWLVAGSLIGAVIATYLQSNTLKWIIGIFILLVAVQLALHVQPKPHRQLPGRAGMGLVGAGIGILSALFGIGGGAITVPFLLWRNVPMRQATAISVVCGLAIALAGAAGFMLAGEEAAQLTAPFARWSSGFVYWPAFAGIAATSVFMAPVGAWLAQLLPVRWLEIVFAVVLAATALKMFAL